MIIPSSIPPTFLPLPLPPLPPLPPPLPLYPHLRHLLYPLTYRASNTPSGPPLNPIIIKKYGYPPPPPFDKIYHFMCIII